MEQKLIVSASPHLRSGATTQKIMLDVIIALAPAAVASVILFGPRALLLMAVSVASCVLCEYICRRVLKRPQTVNDLSAVVTGLLLAFNLPPEINPLVAVFGAVVAIVVVKQMFGGIGQNFVNPALTARIILMTSFPTRMNHIPELKKLCQPGGHFFDADTLTDQPERVIAGEIVREKLLRLLDKEIPHGAAVVVERMRERGDGSNITDIDATIFCEKENHKAILIGKGGSMLKKIGSYARADMERFFGCRVNLKLWVKVKEDWRNREAVLRTLGYDKTDFNL